METVMVKTIVAGCMVLLATLVLWACNDKKTYSRLILFSLFVVFTRRGKR